MQYVRSISGSVSKTWNSINPATLSGAIDVIVVEQEDGSLACSPFHVRFGKFSLLRPYEKKVEFKVNGVKQDYSMKLGEGGEAFFVFETTEEIPQGLQTSPLMSPAGTPPPRSPTSESLPSLPEPEYLDLSSNERRLHTDTDGKYEAECMNLPSVIESTDDSSQIAGTSRPTTSDSSNANISDFLEPPASDIPLRENARPHLGPNRISRFLSRADLYMTPLTRAESSSPERSRSPPPLPQAEAFNRAISLSRKLSHSNIRSHVTETGDLMLDMQGYKADEEEALRAEAIARRVLADELEGNYDVGALIDADENGNLWIYSSEEAKVAANRKAVFRNRTTHTSADTLSDPGAHSDSDESDSSTGYRRLRHVNRAVTVPPRGILTPPKTPSEHGQRATGNPNRNYAKTLRLTSAQLKALNLKRGSNTLSFTVNKATCQAFMYYWTYDTPIVISDIDGTITKSDALGHVLNMIGRDWTHAGVAKLYTDIVANGYNILYLTSRSVGQADTTRTYLNGINQDGFKLPKGPVILSPDRTIAALRREIYLRKPEVFKMACLRDIRNLFPTDRAPFYAGFGNRLTDALSYRSVNIPSTRIFTINSNAEVQIDLLSLNKYRSSYVNMRELTDQFFPPITLLVPSGGEDFTDFNYWRDPPLEIDEFSASEDEPDDEEGEVGESLSIESEDDGSEDDEIYADDEDFDGQAPGVTANSYFSREVEEEQEQEQEQEPLGESIIGSIETDADQDSELKLEVKLQEDNSQNTKSVEKEPEVSPEREMLTDVEDGSLEDKTQAMVLQDEPNL